MQSFPDPKSVKGSGWPQIIEILDANPPIQLESGLGSWFLYVSPERTRIEGLLKDEAARRSISERVKALLLDPLSSPTDDFLSEYGFQEGPFKWEAESGDQCHVVARHRQHHGFLSTSSDVVSLFLREKVREYSVTEGARDSYFVKWAERAQQCNADEVHVVIVYEGQTNWTQAGMLYKFFAEPAYLPAGSIDLSNLPQMKWSFWIVTRNPHTNEFLKGFSYRNGIWESISPDKS